MTSIFETSKDFATRLDLINSALKKNRIEKKTTTLINDKLELQHKDSGIWNGLKVTFLSLLRVVGYDHFSHVRINNVAKTLLTEFEAHCKQGTMTDAIKSKLQHTILFLNKNSNNKHKLLFKTLSSVEQTYAISNKKKEQEIKKREQIIDDYFENDYVKFNYIKFDYTKFDKQELVINVLEWLFD